MTVSPESIREDQLSQGVALLRPLMESHGFHFALCQSGTSSGGPFAQGEFMRRDRSLSLSVRDGLGAVEYRVGASRISHEEFLRYSGAWGRHSYPRFEGTLLESFAALERDIAQHIQAFLSDSDSEFLAVIRARDTQPSKFKGFAALGGRKREIDPASLSS